MKPTITVFTPTYNRAECLKRCYGSMQRQSDKNFVWMIIDDGSTDYTKTLVNQWQKEKNDFQIEYYYKENGGLHTGYNEAIKQAKTDLMICIDSDDYLVDNAIEEICSFWEKSGSEKYGGIIGLDIFEDGSVIGELPEGIKAVNSIDLLTKKYKIKNGDRKLVIRTDLYKQVAPMPTFDREKNFNPHYMNLEIAKNYDYLIFNKPLCVVEYQEEGMTKNIFKQYLNSPKSFAQTRKLYMSFEKTSPAFKFKTAVHYVSSCKIGKLKRIVKDSPRPVYTALAYPLGIVLSIYIKTKAEKAN